MSGIKSRIQPLSSKLHGKSPLCPWSSAITPLDPRLLRAYPPKEEIRVIDSRGRLKLLEFGARHAFWFPDGMALTAELWSEYLVAFWDHRHNFHQYLRGGVTLTRDDVVFDCGACEGFFTRAALEAGVGKVVCVEPSAVMAECLRLTFAPEISAGRLVVAQVALGSFPGNARFSSSEEDAFAGRFDSEGGQTVEVATLETLSSRYGRPSFIKMDLEGSEYQALHGGVDLLKQHRPKLGITTYHNPWDYAVISSLLRGIGYSTVKPYGVTFRNENTPRPVMVHAWQR